MLCAREPRRLPTAAQVNQPAHKIEASKSFATSSGFLYGKIELPMNVRFAVAMGVYAVLALLGSVLLTGKIRDALWILLAGLAVKTLIVMAQRRGGAEHRGQGARPPARPRPRMGGRTGGRSGTRGDRRAPLQAGSSPPLPGTESWSRARSHFYPGGELLRSNNKSSRRKYIRNS